MKVTYIHHSAFFVETDEACLLFDYFQGTVPEISAEKPLYVFASHRHPDHFSKGIFDLAADHENIKFILSFDIWRKRVPEECQGKTFFLNPGEEYVDELVRVQAFKSTDEGVAFWVSVSGKQVYHAGDLNHWYWEGEDPGWNAEMTAAYRSEIKKMAGWTADVAFLPLDSRLGDGFYLGIDDFMKEVQVQNIFPMHFWGEYDVARRLKALPCAAGYKDRIMEIERDGQEFVL